MYNNEGTFIIFKKKKTLTNYKQPTCHTRQKSWIAITAI